MHNTLLLTRHLGYEAWILASWRRLHKTRNMFLKMYNNTFVPCDICHWSNRSGITDMQWRTKTWRSARSPLLVIKGRDITALMEYIFICSCRVQFQNREQTAGRCSDAVTRYKDTKITTTPFIRSILDLQETRSGRLPIIYSHCSNSAY